MKTIFITHGKIDLTQAVVALRKAGATKITLTIPETDAAEVIPHAPDSFSVPTTSQVKKAQSYAAPKTAASQGQALVRRAEHTTAAPPQRRGRVKHWRNRLYEMARKDHRIELDEVTDHRNCRYPRLAAVRTAERLGYAIHALVSKSWPQRSLEAAVKKSYNQIHRSRGRKHAIKSVRPIMRAEFING